MRAYPSRRALFAIAERVGCTVEELQGRMSSAEITEWLAYFRLAAEDQQKELAKYKQQ